MLKPSLQIRIGQQLTMTPQLQQAIRLLQLSSLELKAEIQEAFECNPMLETDEEHEDESQIIEKPESENDTSENRDSNEIQEITANNTLPDDLPVDSQWDDVYEPSHTPISQATR